MLYQDFSQQNPLTKTIRFELRQIDIDGKLISVKQEKNINSKSYVAVFCTNFFTVINEIEKLISYQKDNIFCLNGKLSIKHRWLKTYTKTDFYREKDNIVNFDRNGRKQGNKTKITDSSVKFLVEFFDNWFKSNQQIVENLSLALSAPLELQKRREEFARQIRTINKRSGFEAIYELFNGNLEHSGNDQDINNIFAQLQECKKQLVLLEKEYLPSQSLGVEICRSSLNYYTVNKNQKDYEQLLIDKNKLIDSPFAYKNGDVGKLKECGFTETELPICQLKEEMKKYKGTQKSSFYEKVNQGKSLKDIKDGKNILLFDDISDEEFRKFKETNDKEKRGKFFIHSFKKYKSYCKIYKDVAVKYGKIKAEIKAIEKEKVDAERLKAWAIILEKEQDKYILNIPRQAGNLPFAKKYLEELSYQTNTPWGFYQFESLTLQALDKLCFGKINNSFAPEIIDELRKKHAGYVDQNNKIKRKDEFDKNNDELIKFYQAVLSLDKTREMLSLQNFSDFTRLIKNQYLSKDEFEQAVKESCYFMQKKSISNEQLGHLMSKYNAQLYKITSYDLEKTRNNPEYHSRIWWEFWSESNAEKDYLTRLNPELKIHQIDILKSANPDPKRSRKGRERLLLTTTISLNATRSSTHLAFQSQDEIKNLINTYNNNFLSKVNRKELYYYGFDRGQRELLTLGLFRFNSNEKFGYKDAQGKNKTAYKPEFINIRAYQINSDKLSDKYTNKIGQEKFIYQSPARFINDSAIIEEVPVSSCLDLSFAKMIAGKLVINGDIATYLELKRVSAMRKIWENTMKGAYKSDNIELDSEKQALYLQYENRRKLENDNLYYFDERFANILTLDKIKNELQEYYNLLKSFDKNVPQAQYAFYSIDKVNHLRDALCANAVGVITYLLSTYDGFLCFEDLNIYNKNKELSRFSGNLASRIEIKVLQKLQTLGKAPPTDKQVLSMVSKKELRQLGAMLYIEGENTSADCPRCGTNKPKENRAEEKFREHAYSCENSLCGFNSQDNRLEFDAIDNSDKVAAYNIANKGYKLINQN